MKTISKAEIDQERVLSDTLERLYDVLQGIELHGEGEHAATIADVARVSTAIITACAERRQQHRDRRRSLEGYDDSELAAYLMTLPDRRREAVLFAISGKDPADVPLFGAHQ